MKRSLVTVNFDARNLTLAGKGVQLTLQKVLRSSDQAPYFSGSYVPFTLGKKYRTPNKNADVSERIGVTIQCQIAYCLAGQPVSAGGCPLPVNGWIA